MKGGGGRIALSPGHNQLFSVYAREKQEGGYQKSRAICHHTKGGLRVKIKRGQAKVRLYSIYNVKVQSL